MTQNGNRVADIQGEDDDVQRAIQAIKERFFQRSGFVGQTNNNNQDHQRSFSRERSDNNRRQDGFNNSGYQQQSKKTLNQNFIDDEWDNAPTYKASTPSYNPQPIRHESRKDDWDSSEHQPSANTYQRSEDNVSSTFDELPKRSYNRPESSFFRGRGGNGDSFNSRSNYGSRDSKPFTSFAQPEPVTTEYVPIDWEKANEEADQARKARWANCPLMVKDFYEEHPEVTNMNDEEVDKFREENKSIVVSRTFANEASTDPMPKPTTKFEHAFEKFPDLMAELKKAGFEKPSPIQSQMWPILLRGEDCIGIAQTGTGKTLAFLLPALIHTDGQPHPRGVAARGGPNVLVLAPTRELAIQIEKEVGKYQFRGIRA